MSGVAIGVDRWRRHHDVSILIAAGGVGRYFGSQPRAKVSMMIMRLPQYGHGRGSARGCSSAASGVSGSFGRVGRASSWRACAMFPGRLPLAGGPLDPIVLVLEGDAVLVGGQQPAIGDRDAVGVA